VPAAGYEPWTLGLRVERSTIVRALKKLAEYTNPLAFHGVSEGDEEEQFDSVDT
jgi:hypothetical protein